MSNIAVLDRVKSPGIAMVDCPQGRFQYQLPNLWSPDTLMAKNCVLDLVSPLYDPGSKATWYDRSGKRNHGTITAALWSQIRSGLRILDFDGATAYADLPATLASTNFAGASAIAILLYFKADILPVGGNIGSLISINNSGGGIALGLDFNSGTNSLRIGGRSQDADGFQSATIVFSDTSVMHFLVGVFDYANDKLFTYYDGTYTSNDVTFGSGTYASTLSGNPVIGARFGTPYDRFFNCKIGMFSAVINTVFTKAQLDSIYAHTKHQYGV